MNVFWNLLSIMGTLFLLLATGFVCRKVHIIDDLASKRLSKLIIAIGQPAMIIAALNNAPYSAGNLKIALWVTLIGFAMHTLLAGVAFLICRGMKKKDRAKIFEFGLVFANCGFLGFPVLDSVFEESMGPGMGSFMGAFYVISFHLFLWTWGIVILSRGRDDIKLTPKKALLNYGTVPCAVGIALYLLKPVFSMPAPVGKTLSYLGGLCTPISLLITGALLATVPLLKMLRTWSLYLQSALGLLVIPACVCLLTKVIGLPDYFILLCTVLAGLPAASTVSMLAELYDIEPAYASQTVGMSSLFTTVTLPGVFLFAQWVIGL